MANNRAYLVCVECLNDKDVPLWGNDGCLIMMFKYYPNKYQKIMDGEYGR